VPVALVHDVRLAFDIGALRYGRSPDAWQIRAGAEHPLCDSAHQGRVSQWWPTRRLSSDSNYFRY